MAKMTSRLMLVALVLVPTGGRAQSVAASDRAPRDAVAAEVALLRQAVERLAAVAVKSQVLAGRLAAQQLRVAQERDAIARAEEAIDAAGRRQERTRATLARASRAVANVVEEPRSELRREVESLLFLDSAFSLRLLRAYSKIKDQTVQRQLVSLMESIAANED